MQHDTSSSNKQLAVQTTLHCLMGCGVGDILGVIIGTLFHFPYGMRIISGVLFGFILGYVFSVFPLIKTNMSFVSASKIVLTTETLSILAMESAEAMTEVLFPGMRKLGLGHVQYWLGLLTALITGFIIAYPVNYLLIRKGIRHSH